MSSFNATEFNQLIGGAEQDTYQYGATTLFNDTSQVGVAGPSRGPIPFCARYSEAGSVAFLYLQTDRVLLTSGAMTTAGNYTIIKLAGTGSTPTCTAVTFTTGKSYVRLTLSGVLDPGSQYMVKVADFTFSDQSPALGVYNIASAIPIYLDAFPVATGIAQVVAFETPWVNTSVMPGFDQAIAVGTPVMSHT